MSDANATVQDLGQERFFALPASASIRLLAPAGCGKTKSLLQRCLTLATRASATGASAPRLLVFTFTRAARDELVTRTKSPEFAPLVNLRIATLNAWGNRRVRAARTGLRLISRQDELRYALMNTLRPVWQKYPRLNALLSDNRRYMRAAKALMPLVDRLKSLGLRHWDLRTVNDVERSFQRLRDIDMGAQIDVIDRTLQSLDLVAADGDRSFAARAFDEFIPFWCEAVGHLHATATITLEDQKYLALKDLLDSISKGAVWQGAAGIDAILVDEFQDINPLDLDLLHAIATISHAPLTLVGDDDQAIYEWRGASPSYILEPDKHLAPSSFTTCILETNYRSPRNIVALSQRLIRHNSRRVDKNVSAHQAVDAQVEVRHVADIHQGIAEVVELVNATLADASSPSQAEPSRPSRIALISRKRSQLIPYQIAFASRSIEFCAAEDLSIFLSEAFTNLIKVLEARSAVDQRVGQAWGFEPASMTLELCELIGRFPLAKAKHQALKAHLFNSRPTTLNAALTALRTFTGTLPRPVGEYADALAALYAAPNVDDALRVISREFQGLQQDYDKSADDIYYTDPPFLHLAEYAAPHGSNFGAFIAEIRSAAASLSAPAAEDEVDDQFQRRLHLMTALRAKGKEFDTVVVLDANQEIWPSKLAITANELEAERRVFYVAMTRARRHLVFLVSASTPGNASAAPSPYLAEMGLL
jgi:DNA helicase-2/ATP-dependent DNA helicase PcrA